MRVKHISVCILFILNIPILYCQWSSDPSENTRVTHGGLLPQIISDGFGGAYIVYQDSSALLRQLWVQRLDRHGFVRFPDSRILRQPNGTTFQAVERDDEWVRFCKTFEG